LQARIATDCPRHTGMTGNACDARDVITPHTMRIVLTLLIAVAAALWLLAWWLISEPIGASATASRSHDSASMPERASTAPAAVSTIAPPSATRQPAAVATPTPPAVHTPAVPSPPIPQLPPGAAIDPFAEGGPRPVMAQPLPRVPPTAPVQQNAASSAPPPAAPGPARRTGSP
jgi:hypothetical protein